MITKETAVRLRYRDILEHVSLKNADGTPLRCRVNGKCKTWVTRKDAFRLPAKYGLNSCFYIDNHNAAEWNLSVTYYRFTLKY
jgi:hypothetical protein